MCVYVKNAQKKNFSSLNFKTKFLLIGKIWKSFRPGSKHLCFFGVYILKEKKKNLCKLSKLAFAFFKFWGIWISSKSLKVALNFKLQWNLFLSLNSGVVWQAWVTGKWSSYWLRRTADPGWAETERCSPRLYPSSLILAVWLRTHHIPSWSSISSLAKCGWYPNSEGCLRGFHKLGTQKALCGDRRIWGAELRRPLPARGTHAQAGMPVVWNSAARSLNIWLLI